MKRAPEIWKDIAGFEGRYQVSSHGRVRHLPNGHILAGNKSVIFHVRVGEQKGFTITQLVGQAFVGPLPPGFVYYHKNGLTTDNAAENIGITKKGTIYARRYKKCMKPIVQINRDGEIVAAYKSLTEAARHTPFYPAYLANLCNGYYMGHGRKHLFKSVFATDGYAYSWDDEESIRRKLFQIEAELRDEPVIVNLDGYDAIPEKEIPPKAGDACWMTAE